MGASGVALMSVRLAAEKVGVPYRAFGTVPDVKFDAFRLDRSTCCVTDEADNRASGTVPDVRLLLIMKSNLRAELQN